MRQLLDKTPQVTIEGISKDSQNTVSRSVSVMKVSNQLLENIGKTNRQREALVLSPPINGSKEITATETYYTPEEESLIFSLASFVSDSLEKNKALLTYTDRLGADISERQYNEGEPLPNRVSIVIDINPLARLRYGIDSGKVDNVKKNRLYRVGEDGKRSGELVDLSNKLKVFTMRIGEDRTITLRAPLITLGKDVSLVEAGVVKRRAVEVFFEDVFLLDIMKNYSLIPKSYPFLRAKSKTTEVFCIIEKRLLLERGIKLKKYKYERVGIERDKKSTPEEKEEKIKKLETKYLAVEMLESSIIKALSTKTYYKDKEGKKLDRKRLKGDIERATSDLKATGIIKGAKEGKSSDGKEPKYLFILNESWMKEEVIEADLFIELSPKE